MNSELAKLQEKYKDDPDTLKREEKKLYLKYGNPLIRARAIPESKKLAGHLLLGKGLDTIEKTANYLNSVQKELTPRDWDTRDVEKKAYMWQLAIGRPPIPAKKGMDKDLLPVPLVQLGIGR